MRKIFCAIAAALVLLAPISPLRADAVDDCSGDDPEKVVFGCLSLILGHLSGERPMSDKERSIAHYNLALASEDLDNSDGAIQHYGIALTLDSGLADAYVGRGALLVDRGRFDDAITDLDSAIALEPNDPEMSYHRARAYRGKGDFDKAEADLTRAIGMDPHPLFYNARGSTRLLARRLDAALADFDKVVELNPKMYVGHTNRAAVLVELGDLDAAAVSFGRAIEHAPKVLNSYTDRAQVYLKLGKAREALRDCDAALAISATFPLGYYVRGLAHEALGETAEAIADYRRHVALEPDSGLGREALARLGEAP
jgi:tetratricopeptide (TPR) repeat protein